jgi:hypothetical protein
MKESEEKTNKSSQNWLTGLANLDALSSTFGVV